MCNMENLKQLLFLTNELEQLYKTHADTCFSTMARPISWKRLELESLLSLKAEEAKFLLHSNSSSSMFSRKLNQFLRSNCCPHPNQIFVPATLWFANIPIPTLSLTQLNTFNAPCTKEEILAALVRMAIHLLIIISFPLY